VARAGPITATARGAGIGRGVDAAAPRVAVWPVPRVPLLATRGPRPFGPPRGLPAPFPPGGATPTMALSFLHRKVPWQQAPRLRGWCARHFARRLRFWRAASHPR